MSTYKDPFLSIEETVQAWALQSIATESYSLVCENIDAAKAMHICPYTTQILKDTSSY